MSSTSAILKADAPLRKRFKILEKAQSLASAPVATASSSSDRPKLIPLEMKHTTFPVEEVFTTSPTEYESQTSSDDSEENDGGNGDEDEGEADIDAGKEDEVEPQRAPSPLKVDTRNLRSRTSVSRERSPMSPKSRAWYEFDLAVVVALVSPIGNLLTGGDHVKNLLLIVLLIFYLHQIIEGEFSFLAI